MLLASILSRNVWKIKLPMEARRYNSFKPSSDIPLISPLFNHRMLGKSHFMTNIDEETILELLQSMSEIPINKSEYKYINYTDLPRRKNLPSLPTELNKESIVNYVSELTNYQYPRQSTHQINELLTNIVDSNPAYLNKETFLKIVLVQHYTANDRDKFHTLTNMKVKAEIKQDIDFDNVLLSPNRRPSNYKFFIERLENLKEKGTTVNNNTFYYIFNSFKNAEPKVKMIEMMQDLEVPLTPILTSLSSIIEYFTPEKIIEIYEKEEISYENGNFSSSLFNQLVACYLKDDRITEAWELVEASKYKDVHTSSLFVTFINHFLKNNQLGFAFAFSNYFWVHYGVNSSFILKSMLLNVYLVECEYFPNWLNLVRLVYPKNEEKSGFINSKTIPYLNDYCSLHNLENTFNITTKETKILKNKIFKNLIWNDKPIFELEKNSKDFIQVAKLINQTN
jgi:hypothetical protein